MKIPRRRSFELDLLAQYSIGLKLRALRNEKRLTLSRLAIVTGLSTALLSKLETQQMVPTLSTLARLGQNFGVGLDYFFADAEQHSVSISRKAHLTGPARGTEIIKSIPLHMQGANETLAANLMEFPPGINSLVGKHGEITEIAAYVIEGVLRMELGGTSETLNVGDCVVLKTSASVFWGATGDVVCRAFVVSAQRLT